MPKKKTPKAPSRIHFNFETVYLLYSEIEPEEMQGNLGRSETGDSARVLTGTQAKVGTQEQTAGIT